jgi:phospholipid/cholesterol/gamma-HCH transport system substrate-binding protein
MAQANRSIEVGTGLFVLLGFVALGFLTTQLPGSGLHLKRASESYAVTAKFDDIGGLKVGAPVSMSGVSIGQVSAIGYDMSDAAIQTSGLLGANYIAISPGGSETFLQAGGQLQFTQSAIVIETLINKLFANFSSSKNSGDDSKGAPGKPAK